MTIQTSYPFELGAPEVPGLDYDTRPKFDASVYASSAIEFGRGVVRGSGSNTLGNAEVELPADATGSFWGVARLDHGQPVTGEPAGLTDLVDTQIARYEAGAAISLRRQGSIWVEVTGAVAIGDPVYLISTADSAADAGKFDNADSGASLLVENAEFITAAIGAGVAAIWLRV